MYNVHIKVQVIRWEIDRWFCLFKKFLEYQNCQELKQKCAWRFLLQSTGTTLIGFQVNLFTNFLPIIIGYKFCLK